MYCFASDSLLRILQRLGTPYCTKLLTCNLLFDLCKFIKADLHFGSFGRRPKRLATTHSQPSVALFAIVVLEVEVTSTFHVTAMLRADFSQSEAWILNDSGKRKWRICPGPKLASNYNLEE